MSVNAAAGHPHHGRIGPARLIAALAAGPTAWALQLIAGYGLSSLTCFPHDRPITQSPPPGWSGEPVLLLAINIACLLLALAGAGLSYAGWRGSVGQGRSRFLAACGVMSGLGFALAILFDTAPILGVPACWSIAP
jgi:hypothetical protein